MHLSILHIGLGLAFLAFNSICIKYSDAAVGKSFSLVIPGGNDGRSCAVEVPSKEEFRSDFIQCGVSCTVEPTYIYFSYTKETQRCVSFDSLPTTFASVDSCSTYRVLNLEIYPQDVSVFVGSPTKLECRRSSQMVEWTHAEGDNATSMVIVERCQVVDEFTDLYAVDGSALSCNLIINNVTTKHGGLYACSDQLSKETPATAKVLVLAPSCNTSASNGTILNGVSLQLSCTVNYVGNLVPSVEWRDFMNQAVMNATTNVTASIATSSISIPAFLPVVKWFTFVTYMSTAPTYTYTWTSNDVAVLCPDGFQQLPGSNTCYQAIMFNVGNWMAAGQVCDSLFNGSYSAVLTSHDESIAIAEYLKQKIKKNTTAWSPVQQKIFWTSGQRLTDCSSPFVWKPKPDVAVIPFEYLNWAASQPDCTGNSEFCIGTAPARNYSWNDYSCSLTCCVLCEYGPF